MLRLLKMKERRAQHVGAAFTMVGLITQSLIKLPLLHNLYAQHREGGVEKGAAAPPAPHDGTNDLMLVKEQTAASAAASQWAALRDAPAHAMTVRLVAAAVQSRVLWA